MERPQARQHRLGEALRQHTSADDDVVVVDVYLEVGEVIRVVPTDVQVLVTIWEGEKEEKTELTSLGQYNMWDRRLPRHGKAFKAGRGGWVGGSGWVDAGAASLDDAATTLLPTHTTSTASI